MPKISLEPGEPPEPVLDPLPAAEVEAKEITQVLGGQPLIGTQATESAVAKLMPKAQIIHLATHGLLGDFSDRVMPGAVVLAASGQDDGLLTANEIFEMKLKAELVVLSACQTGLGRITGDGVIGLSRSFFKAGVPSVIVSVWKVPDAPTAMLMTEFYKNLQDTPDKAQALRNAMLTTMKKYPEPGEWSAFNLIGEP
jgi:CHAT domain-containing protein